MPKKETLTDIIKAIPDGVKWLLRNDKTKGFFAHVSIGEFNPIVIDTRKRVQDNATIRKGGITSKVYADTAEGALKSALLGFNVEVERMAG